MIIYYIYDNVLILKIHFVLLVYFYIDLKRAGDFLKLSAGIYLRYFNFRNVYLLTDQSLKMLCI